MDEKTICTVLGSELRHQLDKLLMLSYPSVYGKLPEQEYEKMQKVREILVDTPKNIADIMKLLNKYGCITLSEEKAAKELIKDLNIYIEMVEDEIKKGMTDIDKFYSYNRVPQRTEDITYYLSALTGKILKENKGLIHKTEDWKLVKELYEESESREW